MYSTGAHLWVLESTDAHAYLSTVDSPNMHEQDNREEVDWGGGGGLLSISYSQCSPNSSPILY